MRSFSVASAAAAGAVAPRGPSCHQTLCGACHTAFARRLVLVASPGKRVNGGKVAETWNGSPKRVPISAGAPKSVIYDV